MAIDWGGAFSGALDLLQGQQIGGAPALPSYFQPGTAGILQADGADMPTNVQVNTRTGQVTKCRRRRRRRLLTPTDLSDLAALKTITGNNDALKMAVVKAVRR